ncbi:hypothetical protein F53441_10614 [Fusarium austroafricanum]|uniref:C2H2-type domain-containing protein n=1 Tax=Fusarium austroafricanum TaxID=2364996 RepID=A0A8H4NS41_9HYPO|nr:hypothetical protein F53441_10614 [Fusarium austroafricanum]
MSIKLKQVSMRSAKASWPANRRGLPAESSPPSPQTAREPAHSSARAACPHRVDSERGATRTGVGGSRAAEDLGRALTEVDGLFAGLKYLDATEPESGTSRRPFHQDNLALELDSLCTSAPASNPQDSQPYNPDPKVQARENAWSSIRTVRDGMQVLWEHFVNIAHDLNLPAVNHIHNEYEDAKGLRQAGVFAFRNTLTGPAPNDLTKIFAFCSLSNVVSRLLYARERLVKGDILAGIRLWLDALEREDEREAFKKLAERLWPEAQDHLHFMDLGFDEPTQKLATSLRRGGTPFSVQSTYTYSTSPNTIGLGLQSSAIYGQSTKTYAYQQTSPSDLNSTLDFDNIDPLFLNTQALNISPDYAQQLFSLANEEFNFAAVFSAPPICFPDPLPAPCQWVDSGPGQSLDFDMNTLGGTPPWSTMYQSNVGSPIAISSGQEQYDQSLSSTPTGTDTLKLLRETSLFTAVLKYIRDNSKFWEKLAGCGLVSKDLRSILAWGQERSRDKKRIHASYIQPLLSEKYTRDRPSRGILSVVESFFDWGLLQNIEDIKHYMESMAGLLFHSQTACQEFCDWFHGVQESPKPPSPTSKPPTTRKRLSCDEPGCDYTSVRPWNMERHRLKVHPSREEHITDPTILQSLTALTPMLFLQSELERYWTRFISIDSSQALPTLQPDLENLLRSFRHSTQLCEKAIITLQNVLMGASPHTLDAIFSLCSLSYITSCCLQINGKPGYYDICFDTNAWQSTISDPIQRSVFNHLASILWSFTPTPIPTSSAALYPAAPSTPGLSSSFVPQITLNQTSSSELGFIEDYMPLNHFPELFSGLEHKQHPWITLRESASMSNMIYFLKECEELLNIFSGDGVTTKDPYSRIAFYREGPETKDYLNLCIQRLREDNSFQEPSTSAILCIAERFVDLAYLQTIEELRAYALMIGKVILPTKRAFATFCESVFASTSFIKRPSISSPKVPCGVCGKEYAKKSNMTRHAKEKHGPNTC